MKTEVWKAQKSVTKFNLEGVYCSVEFGVVKLVSFLGTDYYCIDQATVLHFLSSLSLAAGFSVLQCSWVVSSSPRNPAKELRIYPIEEGWCSYLDIIIRNNLSE